MESEVSQRDSDIIACELSTGYSVYKIIFSLFINETGVHVGDLRILVYKIFTRILVNPYIVLCFIFVFITYGWPISEKLKSPGLLSGNEIKLVRPRRKLN